MSAMAAREMVVPVLTMLLATCETALERLSDEESFRDAELVTDLENMVARVRKTLTTLRGAPAAD
jgi:hypothetical protein